MVSVVDARGIAAAVAARRPRRAALGATECDAGPGDPDQQQRQGDVRRLGQTAVQEQVSDCGRHERHAQRRAREAQPARHDAVAQRQGAAGRRHGGEQQHLHAVQPV
jgi:hypothetical protein